MKSFNTNEVPTQLTERVEIGWEHEIVNDETGTRLVYRLDDAGNRVPRIYDIPTALSANELVKIYRSLTAGQLDNIAKRLTTGDVTAVVELAGLVFGADVVLGIAQDPTVSTEGFMAFCNQALRSLGFQEARPEEEPADDSPFMPDGVSGSPSES